MTTILGFDASRWQGRISWPQLPRDGVSFVMMKASEGALAPGTPDAAAVAQFGLDPMFRTNWAASRSVGLVRGAYHFLRPDLRNSPEAEAEWFFSVVRGDLQPGDLLACDCESGAGNLAGYAHRFMAHLELLCGFPPLFYASPSFLAAHGITYANLGKEFGLWEAFWTSRMPGPAAGWPFIAMWQNTDAGTLAGIAGRVDEDVFQGDVATLRKYGKPGANSMGSGSVTPPAPRPTPPPPTPAPPVTPAPTVVHDGPRAPGFGDSPSNGTPDACPAPAAPPAPRSLQDILVVLLGWLKAWVKTK